MGKTTPPWDGVELRPGPPGPRTLRRSASGCGGGLGSCGCGCCGRRGWRIPLCFPMSLLAGRSGFCGAAGGEQSSRTAADKDGGVSSPTSIAHLAAAVNGTPPERIWLAYVMSTPRSQTQEPASNPAVFPSSRGLFVGGGAWAMAGGIADGGFC